MIRPFLYLLGYCVMSVSEARCADLVNALSRSGIVYHVIGSYNDSDGSRRIRLRVTPFSAMRISVLCESIGIEIRIDQKAGLPFLLSRLMKRPGLVVGAVLCCFIIILSGRVLWDIRIEGNNTVPDERIMTVLKECGVSVGCDKTELDIDSVENRFLIRSDEISWISVNVIGTVAEVEVREIAVAEEKPDIVSSNLVATKNGIVAEFDKVKGNIQVTLGEAVSEGQLLVGGMYGSDTEALRFVRSSGRVMALCESEYSIAVPMNFEKKVYTGEQKIKKSLIFFEKEVKFFRNSGNLYATCDTIDTVEYFNLFGLGELPFGIRTVRYVEYETQTAKRSENEAYEQANFLLWQKFFEDCPEAQMVGKRISGRKEGEEYILNATVESIENIAKEVEIELNITG